MCVSCMCARGLCVSPVCLLVNRDELTLEQDRSLIQYDNTQARRWEPSDTSAGSAKKASKLLQAVVRHGAHRRDQLSYT